MTRPRRDMECCVRCDAEKARLGKRWPGDVMLLGPQGDCLHHGDCGGMDVDGATAEALRALSSGEVRLTTARRPTGCPEEHVQYVMCRVLDELGVRWWHTANEALGDRKGESPREAALRASFLVGQGVKAGVLDFTITTRAPAEWARHFRGIDLEAKKIGGRLSTDQARWIVGLREDEHFADWFEGTHAGLDILRKLGWNVDAALGRIASRGEVLDESGKLVRAATKERGRLVVDSAAMKKTATAARSAPSGAKVGVK